MTTAAAASSLLIVLSVEIEIKELSKQVWIIICVSHRIVSYKSLDFKTE